MADQATAMPAQCTQECVAACNAATAGQDHPGVAGLNAYVGCADITQGDGMLWEVILALLEGFGP